MWRYPVGEGAKRVRTLFVMEIRLDLQDGRSSRLTRELRQRNLSVGVTWLDDGICNVVACQVWKESFDFDGVFLLDNIFRLREKMQINKEDEEKPFLDHLEDLRKMILRMLVCLIITTIGSFTFSKDLMELIRKPADDVWNMYEVSHLPDEISSEDWGNAKTLAYSLPGLTPQGREAALAAVPEQMRQLAEAALVLRTAHQLPEDKRDDFITKAAPTEQIAQLARQLDAVDAVMAEGTGRGALKLMGAFQPGEPFMLSLKLSFYAGIVIAFPFLLYFLLQFIVPGLLENERKLLYKCLAVGFGLFLTGVVFCYLIVLPRVLAFFYQYALDFGISNEWRIGYYISFATQLILMFGIGFELPVVVMPFVKMGILTYDLMKATRRYAIVAIIVLASFITPTPDIVTMLLMALPMYGLYELCIFLAWREAKIQAKEDAEEYARMERDYGVNAQSEPLKESESVESRELLENASQSQETTRS